MLYYSQEGKIFTHIHELGADPMKPTYEQLYAKAQEIVRIYKETYPETDESVLEALFNAHITVLINDNDMEQTS